MQSQPNTLRLKPPVLNHEPDLERFYLAPIAEAACAFVEGYRTAAKKHKEAQLSQLANKRGLKIADLRDLLAYEKLDVLVHRLFKHGFPVPRSKREERHNPIVFYREEVSAEFLEYLKRVDETMPKRYIISGDILRDVVPILEIFSDPQKSKPYFQPFYLADELNIPLAGHLHMEKLILQLERLAEFVPKAPPLPVKMPLTLDI